MLPGVGGATHSEIPLESPFAKVGVGDRVQGEVLPGVCGCPSDAFFCSSPKNGGSRGLISNG
jgi:hypothetical protein